MSHCYRSVVGSLTVLVLSHCPRQLCFPVRAATVATAGRSYKSSHKASVSYLPHYQVTDKVSNLTVNKAERLSPKEPDGFLRKRWQKRAIKKYRNSGLTFVSSKDTWARKYYTKKKKCVYCFSSLSERSLFCADVELSRLSRLQSFVFCLWICFIILVILFGWKSWQNLLIILTLNALWLLVILSRLCC